MDLRTIKEDLLGGNYDSAAQFLKDVRMIFSNSRNYNTNKRSRVSINVTYLVGVSSDKRHFFHIKQKITEIKFRFDIRFCKNYLIFSFFKKSFNDTKFQKKKYKKNSLSIESFHIHSNHFFSFLPLVFLATHFKFISSETKFKKNYK